MFFLSFDPSSLPLAVELKSNDVYWTEHEGWNREARWKTFLLFCANCIYLNDSKWNELCSQKKMFAFQFFLFAIFNLQSLQKKSNNSFVWAQINFFINKTSSLESFFHIKFSFMLRLTRRSFHSTPGNVIVYLVFAHSFHQPASALIQKYRTVKNELKISQKSAASLAFQSTQHDDASCYWNSAVVAHMKIWTFQNKELKLSKPSYSSHAEKWMSKLAESSPLIT